MSVVPCKPGRNRPLRKKDLLYLLIALSLLFSIVLVLIYRDQVARRFGYAIYQRLRSKDDGGQRPFLISDTCSKARCIADSVELQLAMMPAKALGHVDRVLGPEEVAEILSWDPSTRSVLPDRLNGDLAELRDPWMRFYRVAVDFDGDGHVDLPDIHLPLRTAVWSVGPDGTNEYGEGDDIASWDATP